MADKLSNNQVVKISNTCLLAGKIMIQGGSETYRVQDTMTRIAQNAGAGNVSILSTANVIGIGLDDYNQFQIREVKKRTIDLESVNSVNTLSRDFAARKIDLNGLYDRLVGVDRDLRTFGLFARVLSAIVLSATLMVIFTGEFHANDFVLAGLIGGFGYYLYSVLAKYSKLKFISEFTVSIIVSFISASCVKIGIGTNLNDLIIGAVMPLIPGVPLTNSFRDLLESNILSGIVRGVEAILTFCAIGVGVAFIIKAMG